MIANLLPSQGGQSLRQHPAVQPAERVQRQGAELPLPLDQHSSHHVRGGPPQVAGQHCAAEREGVRGRGQVDNFV